ncbi:UV DNA damage repair endonuclease UvsE [Maledivibacter halophilus]|uniref:UV-damage endonuclease n=1 Tax=Maledivibacter halophilus TaxID=36842 RepID=A0A1T5KHS2_9FIRM|nr:UV DNA damage repair endonuclease UvsE [Maledivibacter halophilus]SKC63267.1 UV-damage endonuclease [Maledivibacter halophilus]
MGKFILYTILKNVGDILRINFGYVAMSMMIKDCSPSKTVTAKYLNKIEDEEVRLFKLRSLAKTNIQNTQRLFYHNKAHDIKMYRLTSKLIPLATHPLTQDWDWFADVKDDLRSLGNYANENNFRISAHPDHYTLLNSPKEDVLQSSFKDLDYHYKIFKGMGLDTSAKLILHIGGKYKDKESSIDRFIKNYNNLPMHLKEILILENDDKVYTAKEVLNICQKVNVPMVLDIHHHWCNNNGEDLSDFIADIFNTWEYERVPPKIHLSSPKDKKNFRSHADNIDKDFFLEFLNKTKKLNNNFDVMIEAKNKDLALFNLMKDLESVPQIKILDQASIEY